MIYLTSLTPQIENVHKITAQITIPNKSVKYYLFNHRDVINTEMNNITQII